MGAARRGLCAAMLILQVGATCTAAAVCPGDCTADNGVTVDEIITGVQIALGTAATGDCPSFDRNADDRVTIDELIEAVEAALLGCAAPPTRSPSPTSDPTASPTHTTTVSVTQTPLLGPLFTDVTRAAGVDYLQAHDVPAGFDQLSGGAAAADFDDDGWVDLYVTRLDANGLLFRNRSDGTFEDVTRDAALDGVALRSNGAAWGDIDNDGDLDLYVTTLGVQRFRLFVNDGYGRFTEEAGVRRATIETAGGQYGFGIAFGDYDRDGWLDILVTERQPPEADLAEPAPVRLFRNRGEEAPGFFREATQSAGLAGAVDAFAAVFADMDRDGWDDLLLSGKPRSSRVFWNNGDGTFRDGTVASGVESPFGGVGMAIGDYNADGFLDWFTNAAFLNDVWLRNDGARTFTSTRASPAYSGGGAALFFDYDNDTDLDLLTTGATDLHAAALRLRANVDGTFDHVTGAFGAKLQARLPGLLSFDYDNDGDLDVFATRNGGHPILFRNDDAHQNGWLRVRLVGRDSNRDAVGARITVTPVAGGMPQIRSVLSGTNLAAQSETVGHFGLGAGSAPIWEVRVEWPRTQRVQVFSSVTRNTTITVTEPADQTHPAFTETTVAAGVWYRQSKMPAECNRSYGPNNPPPFHCYPRVTTWVHGGAAAGDYDQDGNIDLFVTRLWDPPLLFRNRGDGTFAEVSATAGLGAVRALNGAAWADIDNDGDRDLFASSAGGMANQLFVNDGTGRFNEEAVARGAAVEDGRPHFGTGVAAGDYDRDGWVDIYVADFGLRDPTGARDFGGPSHCRLLRNRGAAAPGYFDDVTVAAGVTVDHLFNPFHAFAPAFVDLDGDGWQDLTVVADSTQSRLFWNNGDGTFSDATHSAGVALTGGEMGSTFGDYDGDGDLDWFVTAISLTDPYASETSGQNPHNVDADDFGNNLYRYDGNRRFTQQRAEAGVAVGHWGWGSVFFDYDNDGDQDVAMVNGVALPPGFEVFDLYHHDPMRFWRNDGTGHLIERAAAVGLNDDGVGKGILSFDYDNDGDLDLYVVNTEGPPRLYRNDGGNVDGWLRVQVEGQVSNRDGYGARLQLTTVAGAAPQIREVGVASHFLGQSEPTAHFGLGPGTQPVASLVVEWPVSGAVQRFTDLPRNSTVVVREPVLP